MLLLPCNAAIEPVIIIEPLLLNSGSAFCTVKRVPFTLVLNCLSKCASVISPIGAKSKAPALAYKTSIWPFFITVSKSLSRSSRTDESQITPVTFFTYCCYCIVQFFLFAARNKHISYMMRVTNCYIYFVQNLSL